MSPAQFTVAASIVFVMFFAANSMFASKSLPLFARRAFLTLVSVEAALGLCDVWRIYMGAFWGWFFYTHGELNAGTLFSSAQLIALSVAAGLAGFHSAPYKLRYRTYWWALAAVCFFLGVDDFFMFHESLAVAIGLDQFKAVYASVGLMLAAGTFIAQSSRLRRRVGSQILVAQEQRICQRPHSIPAPHWQWAGRLHKRSATLRRRLPRVRLAERSRFDG